MSEAVEEDLGRKLKAALHARSTFQRRITSSRRKCKVTGERESKVIKEVASRGNPVETNVLIQKTRETLECGSTHSLFLSLSVALLRERAREYPGVGTRGCWRRRII